MADTNSGTAEGMIAFLDYLVDKGYSTPSAVNPWVTASRSVLQAVEGEGWLTTDVRELDLEEALGRFETISRGKYKAESLNAYKTRITRAVTAYRQWLIDGTRPSFGTTRTRTRIERPNGGEAGRTPPLVQSPTPGMVTYPFPLANGVIASFTLPTRLPKAEAARIAAFVQAIAIDPVLELPPGQEETS